MFRNLGREDADGRGFCVAPVALSLSGTSRGGATLLLSAPVSPPDAISRIPTRSRARLFLSGVDAGRRAPSQRRPVYEWRCQPVLAG